MYQSALQEHMDHEFGAQYDHVRERYACQIEDARREALIWQEEQEYMTRVWDAGHGTDYEAYEAAWQRTFEYAASGAVDDLLDKSCEFSQQRR